MPEDRELKTVLIRAGDSSDHTECPWCGKVDALQALGDVVLTYPLVRVSLKDKTVATGEGQVHWDSHESQGFECLGCGRLLALPDGWEHEDLS